MKDITSIIPLSEKYAQADNPQYSHGYKNTKFELSDYISYLLLLQPAFTKAQMFERILTIDPLMIDPPKFQDKSILLLFMTKDPLNFGII